MARPKNFLKGWPQIVTSLAICLSAIRVVSGEEKQALPSFSSASAVVDRYFSQQRDYVPSDLISQRDVQSVLASLKSAGWKVADKDQILKRVLPDGDFLVTLLGSKSGRQFARKSASDPLLYDRLDRLAQEAGGKELLESLVKLPDGERYAKSKPQRGALSMLEMLPKGKSGKARKVADYDRPTGRIYTQEQLLKQLRKSHEQAVKTAGNT